MTFDATSNNGFTTENGKRFVVEASQLGLPVNMCEWPDRIKLNLNGATHELVALTRRYDATRYAEERNVTGVELVVIND
jgi:hypothetical protein